MAGSAGLFLALAALLLIACGFAFLLLSTRGTSEAEKKQGGGEQQDVEAEVVVAGRRRGGRMRANRRRGRPEHEAEGEDAVGDDAEPDDGTGGEEELLNRRDARRAEREERRREEQEKQERKSKKRAAYSERQAQKDREREERERAEAEELERLRQEKERAEEEEFDKWRDLIQVDAGGTVEDELQTESQGLLADFVNYIKRKKLVPLEDLAAEFKLRTQEVISRVQALEEMGRITGVMDDRGKFIYISEEEMQNVAQFIKEKGKANGRPHFAQGELDGSSSGETWCMQAA
mmetsp:Transcript_4283/g.15408  ORF Transcript_4283/g.15408 Transcript_4283/m.15408 type:complete len:291 (-) Transcript_4283:629-1501(-)